MRPSIKCPRAAIGLALLSLAGCSEYVTRSDLGSPFAGDAVARNKVVQMIDPWPRASAERRIAYDGEVMRRAVERYHTGRVIRPKGSGTSDAYDASQQNGQQDDAWPQANPAAPK